MTEIFEVQPSKWVLAWIIVIHLLAMAVIAMFVLPIEIKGMLGLLVVILGVWQWRKWSSRIWRLQFDASRGQWKMGSGYQDWNLIDSVQPIYVNDQLIWLKFYCAGRSLTVIAGVDSLSKEKYLRLRRSVICPAALKSYSS